MDEPPFTIIVDSGIKLKRITIRDDFLEAGNSIAVVEANRLKLLQLSEILKDKNVADTVTELTIYARDGEPRTNALLFQLIMEMKSLRVLRFTLTAFVHCLEAMCAGTVEQRKSLEHVQIMHNDCKRLILTDFQRLLQIFPNINRIDITTSEAMLLGEDILHSLAHKIKSIEKLESYTLMEAANVQNMLLRHISYECDADDEDDWVQFLAFVNVHQEIETLTLKVLHCTGKIFNQPMRQLTDLELSIKSTDSDAIGEAVKLSNILQKTPHLKKLSVRYKEQQNECDHQVVQLENLSDVTLKRCALGCETCFITVLESMANVTTLRFLRHSEISLRELTLISKHLQHLQSLQLMFEDVSSNLTAEIHCLTELKQLTSAVTERRPTKQFCSVACTAEAQSVNRQPSWLLNEQRNRKSSKTLSNARGPKIIFSSRCQHSRLVEVNFRKLPDVANRYVQRWSLPNYSQFQLHQ